MSMTVRPAAPSDRPSILALAPRLREGVAPWRDAAAVAVAVEGWVASSLDRSSDSNLAMIVAKLDGVVIGFVSVSERPHWAGDTDAYIGELVVSKDVEGRGVGSQLVSAAIKWGRSKGYRRIAVATGAENRSARRFYASLGFEEEDVTFSAAL
jgi:ribosomal protein S18 acetylase RimI-like enzyme